MNGKTFSIIPSYNEERTISEVIRNLKSKMDMVVVVDDGSSDATSHLATGEGAVVLQHFLNRGQGAALQTGIEYALRHDADIIVTFDGDGQHDPKDILQLIEPLLRGEVDIVLGSRFLKVQSSPPKADPPLAEKFKVQKLGMPILKYIILKLAVLFTRITTGLKITDTHNGLRAMTRYAAEKIQIKQDGYAHASEILEEIATHDLRYMEVPVTIHYTEYSKGKGQSVFNSFKIIWDLFIGRVSR